MRFSKKKKKTDINADFFISIQTGTKSIYNNNNNKIKQKLTSFLN